MTIDEDFLKEYQEKEGKNLDLIINKVGKLAPPVFRADLSPNIWSKIPFSGTTVIQLDPEPEKSLGFEKSKLNKEIRDLVDFAIDTKKLIFTLSWPPTAYRDCDYLEPILEELSPHVHVNSYPAEFKEIYKRSYEELIPLFEISPVGRRLLLSSSSIFERDIIEAQIRGYAKMRLLGLNEFADAYFENILIEPQLSVEILCLADSLFNKPAFDPICPNIAIDAESLYLLKQLDLDQQVISSNNTYPEVGSFLMKQLTHFTSCRTACESVMQNYEDNQLYDIFSALNKSVIEKDKESTLKNASDIEIILENAWKNSRIKWGSRIIKSGVFTTCGILGYTLGGLPGLLGSLGIKIFDSEISNLSESASKIFASPHLITIYDFRKKYRIDS